MRIAIVPLVLVVAGRLIWSTLGSPPTASEPRTRFCVAPLLVEDSFCALLSAFAVSSVFLFLLAHLGRLSIGAIGVGAAAIIAGCLCASRRRGCLRAGFAALPRDLIVAAEFTGIVLVLGVLLPPIDASLGASDSSVYIATARHLASDGTISHRDGVVADLTVAEREVLFRNRFDKDHTGPYARFPGGVPLLSPSRDVVSFYFFHLFPVWLAAGLETLGEPSYLGLLALFAAMGSVSLFFIGRRLGGLVLATSICVAHACFQPQMFFTRLPSSEMLAQALFLGGLLAFLRGLDSPDEGRWPSLRLASLLWGALCLCRVDAIPFLWLGLTAASLLPRRLGIRDEDWGLPMLTSVLFAVLAVYHQAASGIDYVGAVSPGSVSAHIGLYLVRHRWPDAIMLAVLCAGGLIIDHAARATRRSDRVFGAARVFGVVVSGITAARFLSALEWSGVKAHLRWVEMYTTPIVLAALAVGILLAVAAASRRPSRAAAVVIVFFAGPACCYLIDPMTIGHQPFVVRRFVPVIFPLLFAVGLHGWQSGLRRLLGSRAGAARWALLVLACGASARLLTAPAGLIARPPGPDATRGVRRLADVIPGDALILIPDENAGLHLQLALGYGCGRDVLLLPLREPPSAEFDSVESAFLDRQLAKGRRVFVLLPGRTDAARALAARFQLEWRTERTVSYEAIPFAPTDALPGPPFRATIRARLMEVRRLD